MVLKLLPWDLTVGQPEFVGDIDFGAELVFIGKTDGELSLVCPTENCPARTSAREDGWRGMRIEGVLDFSLIGILSKLSGVLAEAGVGIFAVSTYNTDYILVKAEQLACAQSALTAAGYVFINETAD